MRTKGRPPIPGKLDVGIKRAVETLQQNGTETYESCEGGKGHSYPEPTIRFHGTPEAGWRAVAICLAYGLPVASLRRAWNILDSSEPTGPHCELTFKRQLC
jgi:hypothetical protein